MLSARRTSRVAAAPRRVRRPAGRARSWPRTARSRCWSSASASWSTCGCASSGASPSSAIIANLHDVVIILGFFAFFQWEFSLPVLAAVLAVLGYSVNESVVVFDRVRENFRKMRKASRAGGHRQRHHQHHLAHHHHPRLHADDGDFDADLRRRRAALLRAGAHHRHPVRHLLLGAGREPAGHVARRRRAQFVQPTKNTEKDRNEGAVV